MCEIFIIKTRFVNPVMLTRILGTSTARTLFSVKYGVVEMKQFISTPNVVNRRNIGWDVCEEGGGGGEKHATLILSLLLAVKEGLS